NIPRRPAETRIAGIHIHHAVDHDRAGAIERPAFGRSSVHGCVIPCGVYVPEHFPIRRRKGAKVSVHRSGKYRAIYEGYRTGLRRAAARPRRIARRTRREPNSLTVFGAQRAQSSALYRIEALAADRNWPAHDSGRTNHVGNRRVDVAAVARHAPLHATVGAAFPDSRLPEDLAV